MPPRFISRQLSRPTGPLARVMGWLMNRHNAEMNAFAVEQLELGPSDRVLEIGFGGGVALRSLIERAAFVGGVDRSPEMVEWAKAKYSTAVNAGGADFREGTVEAIPFDAASFGKALTVNTVYFWRSLYAGFAEVQRVLTPSGRVVVGFLPKEWMDRLGYPTDVFTPRTNNEINAALLAAGFRQVHTEGPNATTRWNVAVATR